MRARKLALPVPMILLLATGAAFAEDVSPERIQELIEKLSHRYYDERDAARRELEAIGTPAEGALIEAVNGGEYRVRKAAVELLGKLKSAKAVPRLIEALGDPDEEVARAAADALLAIGKDARAAVEARRKEDAGFAKRTEDLLRAWIAYDVEATIDPLLTPADGWGFFEGQYRGVVALGPDAIPVLLAMFTDPTYEFRLVPEERGQRQLVMRIVAGEALAEFPDASFVARLKDALDGKLPETTELWRQNQLMFEEAAAYALWTHGETSYLEGLERRWRDALDRGGFAAGNARHHLAFTVIRQGRYEEAVAIYRSEIAENPDDSGAIFNLATVYGKMGKKELALSTLKEAVEAGYSNVEWLKREGYFECIRGTPEFQAIQQALEGRDQEEGEPQ